MPGSSFQIQAGETLDRAGRDCKPLWHPPTWRMPIAAASIAVWDHDRVLLVRRATAPYCGLWSLPGGRVRPGEFAGVAALRELNEETGISAVRPIEVGAGPQSVLTREFELRVFTARYRGGRARPASDAAAAGWFRLEEIGLLGTTPVSNLTV